MAKPGMGIYKQEKNGEAERESGGREEAAQMPRFFQFNALKHEPTPQLGCPGRWLNKTLIRENTVDCSLSKKNKKNHLNFNQILPSLHLVSPEKRKNSIKIQLGPRLRGES